MQIIGICERNCINAGASNAAAQASASTTAREASASNAAGRASASTTAKEAAASNAAGRASASTNAKHTTASNAAGIERLDAVRDAIASNLEIKKRL